MLHNARARSSFFIAAACAAGALVLAALPGRSPASDWPQILGPDRNGKARDERLDHRWPTAGPRLVWHRAAGAGLAGVAVVGKRAVLFHRVGNESLVEALDATSGNPLWKKAFPASYNGTYHPDGGPRCVPLVHDGYVYVFSAEGDLHCLALGDGSLRWSRRVYEELGGKEGYFGAGSSPIIDSGKLLLNVGGQRGAGLVALSLADGKTLWRATDEDASYSSPTSATIDGARHVIFVTRMNVVSVDPDNGRVRFRFPFGMRGPTVNAANPLVLGKHLFVTASYGVGAKLMAIGKDAATQVWAGDDVLSSQFSTSIEKDGYLYGIDGRQDLGVGRLRCVEALTGKVQWTEEGFGMGTLILADGKLLVMKTDGELIVAEPLPKKHQPLARARLFDGTVQALPALAGGLFYVRDDATLKCFDLRPSRKQEVGDRKPARE